ncbi:MAG: CRISPR-associated helicase Cas3' [candidate division WOR-3 bacterium]
MLFSALVDADFLETEAHFNAKNGQKQYRQRAPDLNPSDALDILAAYVNKVAAETEASDVVKEVRAQLASDCLAAGEKPPGLFTLTAPTGSGKTLAMMVFALKHALCHNLRRIVYVIPYLSIIEQTVHVYRKVFEKAMGPDYVLEHHSLAGTRGQDDGREGDCESARLAAENWDAPIVITTSVQFLESLFSNRPSACRKLHRLARSVILFDEVQTIPLYLAIPTLAALSHLVERYRSTVVFATATQPAFTHLHESVKKWCASGWQPTEIVQHKSAMFNKLRRNKVDWPELDARLGWPELAEILAKDTNRRVLCVVNLKRHALELYRLVRDKLGEDNNLFHLSTNMCPAHRKDVLRAIRNLLGDRGRPPCRLISTQCVEAGVDVDFPVVYRAFGPLDSIAQAAGRCNRNGVVPDKGRLVVFLPEDEKYPQGPYEQAAGVARTLATEKPDIDDPELFQKYYHRLYNITQPEERAAALTEAITNRDFAETCRHYKLIEKGAVNLLVPYDPEIFLSLLAEVRGGYGLTSRWVQKARPYAVSIYRPGDDAPYVRISPDDHPEIPDDWYAVAWNRNEEVIDYYHPKEGLIHRTTERHWIA